MADHVGSVYVNVLPDSEQFVTRLRSQILPPMGRLGNEAGRVFADQFRRRIVNDLPDSIRQTQPRTSQRARESGRAAGDAFGRALDTRITAAIEALPKIRLDADATDADRKLAELRAELARLSTDLSYRRELGLSDVEAMRRLETVRRELHSLTDSHNDINIRVNAAAAEAELAALRAQIAGLGNEAAKSQAKFRPILDSILFLGPALIPAAGGVAGLASALVGLGPAGVLAEKGIQKAIKAGSDLGIEYQRDIARLSAGVNQLETTAAHGLLGGFQQALGKINAELPQTNVLVRQSAELLGDAGQHAVGGLIDGFQTFAPLMLQAEREVDRLAASFERWAAGGGGEKFMRALSQDLEDALPAIGNIAEGAAHLVAALDPLGGGILRAIGGLADAFDRIPIPVLTALAASFVAFRGARLAAAAVDALAVSVTGLSLAEARAGAAAGLQLSRTGALLVGVGRFLPVAAAAVIGVNALTSSTRGWQQSWEQSGDTAKQVGASIVDAIGHVASLNFDFGDIGKRNEWGNSMKQARLDATLFFGQLSQGGAQAKVTLNEISNAADQVLVPAIANITKQWTVANAALRSGSLSSGANAFSSLSESFGQAADNERKWLDVNGKATTVIDGVRVSTSRWTETLQSTNNNTAEAVGIIKGHSEALEKDSQAQRNANIASKNLADVIALAGGKYKLTSQQVDLYASALGITADQMESLDTPTSQIAKRIGDLATAASNGNASFTGFLGAIAQWQTSAQTATDRAALLGAAMVAMNGDTLGYASTMVQAASANQRLVNDLDASAKAAVNWKTGVIDFHNAAAAPLLNDLQQLQTAAMNAAAATYQHEVATKGSAKATKDAADVYYNDTRNALINEADQLGLTKQQATALADTYFKWPKNAKTKLEALGGDAVNETLGKILRVLEHIDGVFTPKVDASQVYSVFDTIRSKYGDLVQYTSEGIKIGAHGPQAKADGGFIVGAGTGTSDSILARVSNGEYVVNAAQTAKHRSLLDAINYKLPGFESGGFVGVTAPKGTGGGGSSSGSSGASKIKVTVDASDLTGFLRALPTYTQTVARSISDAFGPLLSKVRQAGGGKSLVDRLEQENRRLRTIATERDRTEQKLSAATQKLADIRGKYNDTRSAVQNTILGTFDISSAGQAGSVQNGFANGVSGVSTFTTTTGAISAQSILDELKGKVADARKFQTDIQSLEKRGLGQAFLQQFIDAGPAALPQLEALMHATGAQLSSLNANEKQLGSIGASLGKNIADRFYGAGVDAAQGLVNGLKAKDKALTDALDSLADRMVAQIRKRLKIHSPSQVFHELGAFTVQGMVDGMVSQLPAVRDAAAQMANHAVPNSQAAQWRAGGQGAGGPLVSQTIIAAPGQSAFEIGSVSANQTVFALRSR